MFLTWPDEGRWPCWWSSETGSWSWRWGVWFGNLTIWSQLYADDVLQVMIINVLGGGPPLRSESLPPSLRLWSSTYRVEVNVCLKGRGSGICEPCSWVMDGWIEQQMFCWITTSSTVMRALVWSVVMKKELSWKEKLWIYWFVNIPTVTCGHDVWTRTGRTRSKWLKWSSSLEDG